MMSSQHPVHKLSRGEDNTCVPIRLLLILENKNKEEEEENISVSISGQFIHLVYLL